MMSLTISQYSLPLRYWRYLIDAPVTCTVRVSVEWFLEWLALFVIIVYMSKSPAWESEFKEAPEPPPFPQLQKSENS